MTMVSSGAISIGGSATCGGLNRSINIELGRAACASSNLNESALRTLAGVASGAISLSNFYGKANQFAFTISTNSNNVDLRSAALGAGWNGTSKVVATIAPGISINSTSTGTPALTISGAFPNGVELINNGTVAGMGGGGGAGGNAPNATRFSAAANVGSPGEGGGTGLAVGVAVTITNNGTVAGGGGGGGGGGGAAQGAGISTTAGGGGGGGGRSSNTNSAAGPRGTASQGSAIVPGQVGQAGTFNTAGAGGAGGFAQASTAFTRGGNGGAGGGWGSAGTGGGSGTGTTSGTRSYRTGGPAGGAGPATSGNAQINWAVVGTRLGPLN